MMNTIANEAPSTRAPDTDMSDERVPDGKVDNPVRRTIGEFVDLIDGIEELSATYCALGVPRRVINMLVELGLQKQAARQAEGIDAAVEKATEERGEGALSHEDFAAAIADIMRLEQDMAHARQIAAGNGLDVHSLAILSRLVQSNPGDRGEKAANTICAYAQAFGIPLHDVPALTAELTAKPASVLPNIPRDRPDESPRAVRAALLRDALLGLAIGVVVILLIV